MGAGKYRKRPMVVEAIQLERGNFEEAAEWSGSELLHDGHGALLMVPTIHGQVTARQGDWVVRGTQAEFYPVTADVFAQIYEPATSRKAAS